LSWWLFVVKFLCFIL